MTTSTDPSSIEIDDATTAAANEIAQRLRTKSLEQVIATGERTGWWPAELVDWVADGRPGAPPGPSPRYLTLRQDEEKRLDELQNQLEERHVIAAEVDRSDPDTITVTIEPDTSRFDAAIEELRQPTETDGVEGAKDVARSVPDDVGEPAPSGHYTDAPDPAPMAIAGSAYLAVLQGRDLGVDHTYQRPLDEARVRRMVTEWDPRMLGTIDVSDRGADAKPRYAVINGQHRASAAARVSPAGADVWLACTVHEGLDVAAEARLMHELDRTTKKLSGWDKWRARRGAGDTAVLQVEAIAARHGLVVDDLPGPGAMRAYGSAEKLLARGGKQLLDTTLAVLKAAWKDSPSAYQAPLVTGVGSLLQVYGKSVDVDRLSRALEATRPEQLRASATALRDIDGGALHELMTRAIVTQYNRTSGPGPRLGGSRG